MAGNFRGVCPILNRATTITEQVVGYILLWNSTISIPASYGYGVLAALYWISGKTACFFGFFMKHCETHGAVFGG